MVRRWLPVTMLRPAVALLGARASTQLGLLAVSVLVARAVEPSEFGAFSALMAMGTIVVVGAGSGFPVVGLRRVAAGDFDRRLLHRIGTAGLLVTVAASVVVALLAGVVLDVPDTFALGAVSGLAFIAVSTMTLASNIHAGAGRYTTAAAGEAAAAVALIVLTSAALAAGFGIMAALVTLGLAHALGAAWLWSRLPERGDHPADTTKFRPVSRLRTADVVPFLAVGLASSSYVRLDAVVISAVAGTTVLGFYAAAYRLLGVFSLLGNAFGTVFLSRLSALSPDDPGRDRLLRRGRVLFACTALPLMTLMLLLTPTLVPLLFGPEYESAITPARWLLLSVVPYSLYLPIAFSMMAGTGERRWALLLTIGCVTDLVAVALFVPRWDAPGGGAAWLLAESVVCAAVFLSARARARHAVGT